MKILHVLGGIDLARGGPVTALEAQLRLLNRLGHRQEIVAPRNPGATADFGREARVHLFAPSFPRRFHASREANVWLRDHLSNFDLVVVHEIWPLNVLGALRLLARGRVPYFIAPHASLDPDICTGNRAWIKRLFIGWSVRPAVAQARLLIAASAMERERIVRFGTDTPIELLPIPVAPAAPGDRAACRGKLAVGDGELLIVFVGRFHVAKGVELLVETFAQASARAGGLRLALAGSGDAAMEARLRTRVSELGIASRVVFAGFVNAAQRADLLAAGDLYAAFSERENFGIAIVEAMQAGVPVLLTPDIGLAPQIVAAGAGWQCERTLAALSDRLVRLAGDRAAVDRARDAARALGASFEPRALEGAYARLFPREENASAPDVIDADSPQNGTLPGARPRHTPS